MRVYLTTSGSGRTIEIGRAESFEDATKMIYSLDDKFEDLTTAEIQRLPDHHPLSGWEGCDVYAEHEGKTYFFDDQWHLLEEDW